MGDGKKVDITFAFKDAFSRAFSNMATKITTSAKEVATSMGKVDVSTEQVVDSMGKVNVTTKRTIDSMDRMTRSTKKTVQGFESLRGKMVYFNSLLSITASFFNRITSGARGFISLADSITEVNARGQLLNETFGRTVDLNQLIYQASQRSRAGYIETYQAIAKMGILTGDAFGSQEELIGFVETVNKAFAVGGSSIQEQKAAITQLTQAMAAGMVQGEELNTVMSSAPLIAQGLMKTLGTSNLKQAGADRLITAKVVKNAVFGMVDEIDRKLGNMPKTFGQQMENFKNKLIIKMIPLIQQFSNLINSKGFERTMDVLVSAAGVGISAIQKLVNVIGFLASFMKPVLIWATVIIGISLPLAMAKLAVSATKTMLVMAQMWFMALSPMRLFIVLIGLVVAGASHMGYTVGEMVGSIVASFIGAGIGILNFFIGIVNKVIVLVEYLANKVIEPIRSMKNEFFNILKSFITSAQPVIDTLFGSGTTAHTLQLLPSEIGQWDMGRIGRFDPSAAGAVGMKAQTAVDSAISNLFGGQIEDLGDKMDLSQYMKDGAMPVTGEVRIAKEDIEILKKSAYQKTIANYQNVTPTITVNANISQNVDAEDVVNRVVDGFLKSKPLGFGSI